MNSITVYVDDAFKGRIELCSFPRILIFAIARIIHACDLKVPWSIWKPELTCRSIVVINT